MQSMRLPLGSVDTRVRMTDSMADGLLSPSFASVLAFDDSAYYDQALDEIGPRTHATEPAHQVMFNDACEVPQRSCPRLELDPTMDKCHALDGCTEPLDPQNTPASNSGHESPDEASEGRKMENLRTTSAPHLTLSWFERQPDGSLSFLPGEGDDGARTQKRRFSADDEPQPITFPTTIDQPTGVNPCTVPDDVPSSLRCVRFTPPLKPTQQRPSRIVHRIAPYRSSPKASKCVRSSKRKRNIPFSTAPKLPRRPEESYTDSARETSDDVALGSRGQGTKNAGGAPDGALLRQAYGLVAITFGVYQFRYPRSDPRGGVFHIRVDSTVIPTSHLIQETGKQNHAVVQTGVENLLLHTCIIMPAFILRIPLAMLSAADRLANSRVGLVAINALRVLWAVLIRFLVSIISRLLGRDAAYHAETEHGNRHEGQRH